MDEEHKGKVVQLIKASTHERPPQAAPAEAPATDAAEVERLAALPVCDYERAREQAAKQLGVRVGVLDGLVAGRRREAEAATKGNGFADAMEPWPDPVDGAELLGRITDKIKAHVILPEQGAETTALWTLFAHAHDAFSISAILTFQSPTKRCGKSTGLRVLEPLCPSPLTAANITPAATFRVIEAARPTLLIDEGDSFLREDEELRGIFNSGHDRHSAYVWRCVGENQEPQRFTTWAPKCIALIGELPDTLQDRSIVLRLRRKLSSEQVARFRADRAGGLRDLSRQAARWAVDNLEALSAADPETPPQLHDRAADNWRPLLAIADRVGGSWPELARQAALALSGVSAQEDEPTAGVRLLADCRECFEHALADALPPTELVKQLCDLPESPWGEWAKGRPITTRGLARLLKPFGIRSTSPTRDYGPKKERHYLRQSFEDAWKRYLPPDTPFPSVPNCPSLKSLDNSTIASVPNEAFGTDRKDEKPNKINMGHFGTDRNPLPGEEHMETANLPLDAAGEASLKPKPADDEPLEEFEL